MIPGGKINWFIAGNLIIMIFNANYHTRQKLNCNNANLIEIIYADPGYQALPEIEVSIYTPRNVIFKSEDVSCTDCERAEADG
jgi:hypothetical protein